MRVSAGNHDLASSVLSDAGLGASFDTSLMARALAGLYAAGATLALVVVALPRPARSSTLGMLAIVGIAYLVAAILFWRASTISRRVLPLALVWGSTLIAGVAYLSAESPSPLVFFYSWVFLYAFYFLTRRETAVQLVYVGFAYGALLVARPPLSGVAAWWLVGMGSLFVAAILIRSMRARVAALIARLYDTARTDPLTNLPNRHGFRELLDLELERARRAETKMTVVVGDLDHFREVNDRLGAHVGDVALQRVARLLEIRKRQIDGVARVGGEEFALILPATDRHTAFLAAERLRSELREEFARDTVPITISFGAGSYPLDGETAGSLLRAADDALFTAKQCGGDRTVLHSQALGDARPDHADSRDVTGERFIAAVLDLAEAVDLRFSGSARHSETVGRYAEMMARELGLSAQRTGRVRLAGILHDIGKVAVSDSILKKPAKLTNDEFELIKGHPALGAEILGHPSLADLREWVGAHHERPDGHGYPHGLSGDAIPLEARILAVADAYEAMTSDRAYRSSIGQDAARTELERCSGSQFDPLVVDALLNVLQRESTRVGKVPARVLTT
jgi:diguanylate cyclase (GGDEF)-like protein/putative nucleotidyltransferase with HDIG domain